MSTAKFDTLQNAAGTKSVPVSTVVDGSAKAWVNFNGTGTVAIRSAFNVSSVTDNGTGDYTINFTSALTDANYSAMVNAGRAGGDTLGNIANVTDTQTSAGFRMLIRHSGGTITDQVQISCVAYR